MKQVEIAMSVERAAQFSSAFLTDKGFKIFAEIDHAANAAAVELELPASKAIIFGNPLAGTKLMQQDITMSLQLPLRLALVESDGKVYLLHPSHEDFERDHNVSGHPVLANIEALFSALASALNTPD